MRMGRGIGIVPMQGIGINRGSRSRGVVRHVMIASVPTRHSIASLARPMDWTSSRVSRSHERRTALMCCCCDTEIRSCHDACRRCIRPKSLDSESKYSFLVHFCCVYSISC